MTRTAVVEGFEYFLDDAIERTLDEFSVARAFRDGARGPTGAVVDKLLKDSETLHRRVVKPELEAYRQQTLDQFRVVLDYVESDEGIEKYHREILETGAIIDSIRSDVPLEKRKTVQRDLLDHHLELGEAVEPLLDSPKSDFWEATATELTREEAETLVSEAFPFTGPIRRNQDAIAMVTTVDATNVLGSFARVFPKSSFEVEYTEEAVRALYSAEKAVVQGAQGEIDQLYG